MKTRWRSRAVIGACLGAVSVAVVLSGSASAQIIDRTQGSVTRCDLYRTLGRAYPPECGGTGPAMPQVTRGRLSLGAVGPAPAAAPAQPPQAAAPAATPSPAIVTTAPPAIGIGLPILFALDSDALTPSAKELIDELAEVLKYNDTQHYVIEGHTDITGETSHNNTLSLKRAHAVVRYLEQRHGLKGDRFVVRGLGSTQLLLPSDGRNERNRRVQVLRADS